MTKRFLRYLIALAVAFIYTPFAFAIAPIENDGNTPILAGANTITMGTGSFSHIIVWLSSGSSTVYITFNMNVTASASNALMSSGSTVSVGLPGFSAATNQINYFGNGTTGTISWVAW